MASADQPHQGVEQAEERLGAVLARLRSLLPSLAAADRRIAEIVLANPEAVIFLSISELAEQTGTVLSWSADFLTFSMSPPNHYGMITFADGGRFMADITDVEQGQVDSGTKVRMSFRVKDRDERRGFVRYFWKAVPDYRADPGAAAAAE